MTLRVSLQTSLAALVPTLQAEAGRVELELSVTKMRAEEASLRDSLSKLSALNESLAQDKLSLNHLVAQVRPWGLCLIPCPPYSSETPQRRPRPGLGHTPTSLCAPLSLCLGPCLSFFFFFFMATPMAYGHSQARS